MRKKKSTLLAAPFQGKWRVVEMDLWDDEAVNLVTEAFITIKGERGEMRFIAVTAWLDVRYDTRAGEPIAEFSWEGTDEGDARCGRGWLVQGSAGRLVGHIFFHNGDDSGFVCEPW